ncbi:MAG: PASTA domain-containing protein [Crocinitomicaceae bacterium]|nr:PASTA domain-containing protein [Crocinitomicaceae bacterium]MDG1735673.1 PASTA domain-containing protein [Crocinitomicaceae bacterium]
MKDKIKAIFRYRIFLVIKQFFWSKSFLFSSLGIAGIYAGILFGTMRYLDTYTNHGQEVSVPNLVGLSSVEAKLKLEKLGLSYEILDSMYRPKQPNGIVIEQMIDPTAVSKVHVKSNRVIGLRLSKNKELTEMPDLLFDEVEFAKGKLTSRGFSCNIEYEPTIEADGSVLDQKFEGQMIDAGTRIPKGSEITLVVGRSEIGVLLELPNLVGMNYLDAMNLIQTKGFQSFSTICNNCESKSDTLNAVVFGQSPEFYENKTLERSKHITILINAGDPPSENPFE